MTQRNSTARTSNDQGNGTALPLAARCQRHPLRRGWPVSGSLAVTRLCDECRDEFGVEWTDAAVAARRAWAERAPLDPARMLHVYGGIEHAGDGPVEGCLVCTLEAVAAAWFGFDQQALDALLDEYRRDDD